MKNLFFANLKLDYRKLESIVALTIAILCFTYLVVYFVISNGQHINIFKAIVVLIFSILIHYSVALYTTGRNYQQYRSGSLKERYSATFVKKTRFYVYIVYSIIVGPISIYLFATGENFASSLAYVSLFWFPNILIPTMYFIKK